MSGLIDIISITRTPQYFTVKSSQPSIIIYPSVMHSRGLSETTWQCRMYWLLIHRSGPSPPLGGDVSHMIRPRLTNSIDRPRKISIVPVRYLRPHYVLCDVLLNFRQHLSVPKCASTSARQYDSPRPPIPGSYSGSQLDTNISETPINVCHSLSPDCT
jgi:hypothetical protein